jgi:hypothetical protein
MALRHFAAMAYVFREILERFVTLLGRYLLTWTRPQELSAGFLS